MSTADGVGPIFVGSTNNKIQKHENTNYEASLALDSTLFCDPEADFAAYRLSWRVTFSWIVQNDAQTFHHHFSNWN